ncbi:hypothetical protein [Actinophytocola sediminis]
MAEPSAEDVFGPAVIFTALMEAGVSFTFVGFITHYACELYDQQHPGEPSGEGNEPRSHAENRNRLAHALRKLGAAGQTENGTTELFTGDGSALADRHQLFQTPHGVIRTSVRTPTADEEIAGMDTFTAGIRINITVPTSRLRSYVETGKFPGLVGVLEIVELFDAGRAGGDHQRHG